MRKTLVVLLAIASAAFAGDKLAFKKEKEIALGGATKFDYLTVHEKRLYVAHAPKVDVIDLEKGEKVGEVPGVDGAHGIVIRPDVKRGFATAGAKSKLIVFDLDSLKVTKEVATGKKPDACIWVNATGEIWTMNGDGSVSCVDPSSLEVKKSFDVGGKLESAVESAKLGKVFINVEADPGSVAVVDPKEHKVLERWKLEANGPTGIALDEEHGVLFIGADDTLLCVDASTGKTLSTVAIAADCDGVEFDPETGSIFASCGKGPTSVARLKDKKLEIAATFETAENAKNCTLDKATHKLYVACPTKGGKGVTVLVFAPGAAK